MLIKRIDLSAILRLELPALISRAITVIEEHDPEALHIKGFFDILDEQLPQMRYLEALYGPEPLTAKLHALQKKRIKCASAVSAQFRANASANLVPTRDAVEIAQPVVKRYLTNLRKKNEKLIHENIEKFLLSLSDTPELVEAFTLMSMIGYISELKIANKDVITVLNERAKKKSLRNQIDIDSIVKSAITALRNMIIRIEQARIEYPALNYDLLIHDLNVLLNDYAFTITSRAVKNAKKKKAKDTVIENDSTDTHVTSEMMNNRGIEYVMHVEELDKKKTDANVVVNDEQLSVNSKANSSLVG